MRDTTGRAEGTATLLPLVIVAYALYSTVAAYMLPPAVEAADIIVALLILLLRRDLFSALLSLAYLVANTADAIGLIYIIIIIIYKIIKEYRYYKLSRDDVCRIAVEASIALSATAIMLYILSLRYNMYYGSYSRLLTTVLAPMLILSKTYTPLFYLAVISAPYSPVPLALLHTLINEEPGVGRSKNDNNADCINSVAVGEIIAVPAYKYVNIPIGRSVPVALPPRTKWIWRRVFLGRHISLCLDARASPHVLVTGATGAGKTSFIKGLINKIIQKYRYTVIIIDPHGEYKTIASTMQDRYRVRVVSAGEEFLNPLSVYQGRTPRQAAAEFSQLVSSLFGLGALQGYLLYDATLSAYIDKGHDPDRPVNGGNIPSIHDVAKVLLGIEDSSIKRRALSLIPYLDMLKAYFGNQNININTILNSEYNIIIFDLSRVGLREAQVLYIDTLLRLLYSSILAKEKTGKTKYLIVVDEAHIAASKSIKAPMLVKIAAELRKYGVALIAASQQLTHLHREIIANSGYIVALRTNEPEELRYVARLLSGLEDSDRIKLIEYALASLPKGYAIIRHRCHQDPLLIKILIN